MFKRFVLAIGVVVFIVGCSTPQEVVTGPPVDTVDNSVDTPAEGPSPEEVAAFYEAVQTNLFYEAVLAQQWYDAVAQAEQAAAEQAARQAQQVREVPTVPPAIVYETNSIAGDSIEGMICATFGDQCAKALSVVRCESGFNPGVVGGAGERGLFQIHPVHAPNLGAYGGWDAMFDPAANIAYAYALFSGSGWGPWTCA
jgi:hypothetical protein